MPPARRATSRQKESPTEGLAAKPARRVVKPARRAVRPARVVQEPDVTDVLGEFAASAAAASGVGVAVAQRVLAAAASIAAADSGRAGTELALLPRLAALHPMPRAAVEAGRRTAELKRELLNTGAWTTEDLAAARGTSANTTRQWVHRQREAGRLFTVTHDGQALVPAFLLDADLGPRPELADLIAVLAEVGETGWAAWAWLVRPSNWLAGDVPERVATNDPARAVAAARARVSNAL